MSRDQVPELPLQLELLFILRSEDLPEQIRPFDRNHVGVNGFGEFPVFWLESCAFADNSANFPSFN